MKNDVGRLDTQPWEKPQRNWGTEPEIYEGIGAVHTYGYGQKPIKAIEFIKQAQQAEQPVFSQPQAGQKDEPALRYDAGKPRYDLLPADGLEELVQVYTVGAKKYADRNWEKGMSWSRCFGSLLRHSWKFWRGELLDPETGCHHMAHVAWNAIALVCYSMRKVGTDDRPRLSIDTLNKLVEFPYTDDDVRGTLKFNIGK